MNNEEIIITAISNVTKEGLTLHLNEKTNLKNGTLKTNKFWVSWDKIGENLFEKYTKSSDVQKLNEIRLQLLSQPTQGEGEIKRGEIRDMVITGSYLIGDGMREPAHGWKEYAKKLEDILIKNNGQLTPPHPKAESNGKIIKGKLITGDLLENTMTFEVDGDMTLVAGEYFISRKG